MACLNRTTRRFVSLLLVLQILAQCGARSSSSRAIVAFGTVSRYSNSARPLHQHHHIKPPSVISSPVTPSTTHLKAGFVDFFRDLGNELDNMIDDAMDRKLGGGSTFYGERKSNFNDKTKKSYYNQFTTTTEAFKNRENAAATEQTSPASIRNNKLLGGTITGDELRQLIVNKWGQPFPVLIKRRRDALGEQRLFLIVQWKQLGKNNLNLSQDEYIAESDAVADLVTEWGLANSIRNEIAESSARPKTMTQQYPGLFIALNNVDPSIIRSW